MNGPTPVTVLAGFLGSGKTTLLARALADARFRDTAVIVNEVGEAPLDHHLLREASGAPVAIAGGCVCCAMAGDLVRALRELYVARVERRVPAFERVVIETTGLADAPAVLASLAQLPVVASRYALGRVATVIDAEHGAATLAARAEARAQAAVADVLVLSKIDRVGGTVRASLVETLRALNPHAPLLRNDADPAGWLEAPGAARPLGATGWLDDTRERLGPPTAPAHGAGLRTTAWRHPEPLPWARVETALAALVARLGPRLLRLKGTVAVEGEPEPRAVHAVRHTLYPSARIANGDPAAGTALVLVTEGLEDAEIARILSTFPPPP